MFNMSALNSTKIPREFIRKNLSIIIAFFCILAMIYLAGKANYAITKHDIGEEGTYYTQEDIYYHFQEGNRIAKGENPYIRILGSDFRQNSKYATYFPLFYETVALTIRLGMDKFGEWLQFSVNIFYIFEYAIAIVMFAALAFKKMEWGGVAAVGFWLFNRWTMYIITTANYDFIPIFFLVIAIVLYPQKKFLSLLFFSISLALKQIGIIVAPLFVIWAFLAEEKKHIGFEQSVKTVVLIGSIPFISSLPFMINNFEAYIRSIAFSATRLPSTHLLVPSIDALLGVEGPGARILMVIFFLILYLIAACGILKKYLSLVLIFVVYISFNTILFNQYFVWLISFIPFLILDHSKT
jgi:hypothetical protein